MATVTLGGNAFHTSGELPAIGSQATDFELIQNDLSTCKLSDLKGKRLILNIFPSIDTGTCAASVRRFNQIAGSLINTQVICISRDLPFAQKRFCGSEGIDHVATMSDFRSGNFGKNYGIELIDGPLQGLHARSIVVMDENQQIIHTELVPDIANEPNYEAALQILK